MAESRLARQSAPDKSPQWISGAVAVDMVRDAKGMAWSKPTATAWVVEQILAGRLGLRPDGDLTRDDIAESHAYWLEHPPEKGVDPWYGPRFWWGENIDCAQLEALNAGETGAPKKRRGRDVTYSWARIAVAAAIDAGQWWRPGVDDREALIARVQKIAEEIDGKACSRTAAQPIAGAIAEVLARRASK